MTDIELMRALVGPENKGVGEAECLLCDVRVGKSIESAPAHDVVRFLEEHQTHKGCTLLYYAT